MLSFWNLSVRLAALACLVAGAVVFAARGAAAPSASSLLTRNTCALPCVFGITPGVTSRDQAMRTFERSALSFALLRESQPSSILRESDAARTMMMRISFGSQTGATVRSVQLYEMSAALNLGSISDFLLAGYRPTRVYSGCTNVQRMLLEWGDTYVQVALGARFEPASRVMLIDVSGDSADTAASLATFNCTAVSDWMGFAPQWKYRAAS